MKRKQYIILLALLVGMVSVSQAEKFKKIAQTGFQLMSVETDARAAALAGAMTTLDNGSGALFHNPATMGYLGKKVDLALNYNRWIADIQHTSASIAFAPAQSKYGVFGFSWHYVDYGEIQGALPWANNQGYIKTEMFHPSALMFGAGYAKALSSKFSIGTQFKYVGQQLGNSLVQLGETEDSLAVRKYKQFGMAFDFGTLFKTGWKSLVFGMSVRNFSNEIQYEAESFQLPLTFSMGISMNVMDLFTRISENHRLLLSLDAVHPRSYPEYLDVGIEYSLRNLIHLRYGYLGNRDERSSTFGIGLQVANIQFDYCYIPFGVFNETQNFTLRFGL